MREMPPVLQGDALGQIAALRDYLVRLELDREREAGAASAGEKESAASRAGAKAPVGTGARRAKAADPEITRAAQLRALIVKTAEDSRDRDDVIRESVGDLSRELRQTYLARSEFGTYRQEIALLIETTARQIVESYEYAEQLLAARAQLGELGEELAEVRQEIRGQIRRGYLEDPDSHRTVLGIAISQQLRFTGQEMTDGGRTYFELSPGQTLGLYTSTGWQFWVNGRKVGWFDSGDGMLHTVSQAVEEEIRLGSWTASGAAGFGLKFTG